MYFPKDVIIIIREFSQPITRPDWRKLHIMTTHKFNDEIRNKYHNFNIPVINSLVKRYGRNTEQVRRVEPNETCAYVIQLWLYVITGCSILGMFGAFVFLPRVQI